MMVRREIDQSILVQNLYLADNYLRRLMGWIGKREARPGEGMLITPCNSVHMWMMSIPIDVVFLSRDLTILKMISNLKPWRPLPVICMGAASALELPAGTIAERKLKDGEVLCIA